MSQLYEKYDVLPDIEEDVTEPDGFAHHVRIKALLSGGVIVALCGKRFIPTIIAGAEKKEVCGRCSELMELLKQMYGDD